MRVLVIGGTGFLGLPLSTWLIEAGHEVGVFHRGRTEPDLPPMVKRLIGDRHCLDEHSGELRRFAPEVVIDMIAYSESDARGLVRAFRGHARRTVVVSSADVYRAYGRFLGSEDGPEEPTPLSEDAPLRSHLFPYRHRATGPDDFHYHYDKIPIERVVMDEPELPGTVLRLPMVHGPGDPYRRLAPYLRRMDDGREAILMHSTMAGWKCPRGFVLNVAAAIGLAATDDRARGRIFNVADSVSDTELEWVRRLGRAAGWHGSVIPVSHGRVPMPFHPEQSLDTDARRIRRELGYAEPFSIEHGLQATIGWERSQPLASPHGIGLLEYGEEDAIRNAGSTGV
jgi:nucleoside-diphosphate-sugar epimerase